MERSEQLTHEQEQDQQASPDAVALNPWRPETDLIRLALLGKFLEELGEATAITARCVIQGINESEPVTGAVNRYALEDEVADVLAAAEALISGLQLNTHRMYARKVKKMNHLERWHKLIDGFYNV